MLRNVDELVWRPATELAALIRSKQISPVELTEAVLARIDALNPRLNAFCLVAHDLARRGAREAEIAVTKAEPLGALHGVPLSIKDVIFTRGLRTTGGSRLFAEAVPDDDAVVVGRLRAAGAVILGKTTTSEFGHKAVTESPLFGITRNPWNLELSPGGSSGGAAVAVASGLGPVALGTDAGGSVRIPASFCGVYGFKPSRGRVPDTLGFPGYEHVNCPRPLTRSVRDAALVLDVIAGGDDRDRFSLPRESRQYVEACDEAIKGLHVAWTPDLGFATVDPGVQAICENAAAEFEGLGCHVEVVNPGWDNPEETFSTLIATQFYAHWSDQLPEAEKHLDPTLVRFIGRGAGVSARDYVLAYERVKVYWAEIHAFLARFDLLLTPTVAVPPFASGQAPRRDIAGPRVPDPRRSADDRDLAGGHRRPVDPVPCSPVPRQTLPQAHRLVVGLGGPDGVHRDPGHPGDHFPDPRRDHRAGRRRTVRHPVGSHLLDHRTHRGDAGVLLGRTQVGRAAGASMAVRAQLESAQLHHRSRGRDPLLHPLSDSRLPEGHHFVPLRDQPDALLALCSGFNPWAHSWHMDLVLLRCQRGRPAVHLRHRVLRPDLRLLPSGLLLSR